MRNLFTKMGGVESAARKMGKNILSLLLLTSLATTSCKDDSTELRSALGEQLTLSVGVNSSTASRAMVIGTQLPEGSSIGVRVTDGGADYQGTDYSHVRFTSAGSGEAQKWTAEPPVYLSGQAATIYAYSPYQSTEGFEMTAIPVDMTEADQTDWLYATPVTGPCDSSPKADITLNHALTAFTLSFHKEGYPGAGEVTAVKIQSAALATGGTLDATAGEFTAVTGQGDALTRTAAFTLADAVTSASTVQVMTVPTALKAALNITVTVDGKDYTAATSSMNFMAGHNYALTMKLTAKDLGLSEVEIIDWQNVDLGEDELQPDISFLYSNYIQLIYNITDVSTPTKLFNDEYDEDYYESMGERVYFLNLDDVDEMLITDKKENNPVKLQNAVHYYKFDNPGEYVVYLKLKDMTSIPAGICRKCHNLISFKLPASVTCIEERAFENCTGMTGELIIPQSVKYIYSEAFINCWRLTSIVLPETLEVFGNRVIKGCHGLTGTFEIPVCKTIIGKWDFANCVGLSEIILHNKIKEIGSEAFYGCSGLMSVTLPGTLETIGNGAFEGCTGLTEITISEGVTSIGTSAFEGCTGLTLLSLPGTLETIGVGAFEGCTGLTEITILEGVTSIGNSAFYGCYNLATITSLATTAPTISSNTFYGVKSAGKLYIPAGATGYDEWMKTTSYYLGKYNWTIQEQ